MALGFINRKKKGGGEDVAAETAEQQAQSSDSRKRKRKPNEMLSSVVKESEPGAAVDLLVRNDRFALPNDAGWVILLLQTDDPDFGGLSAKQRSNPDKGSIIELITADEIEVVVTAEMLDLNLLGLVPTEKTLDRMSEYRLLKDAPYLWAVMRTQEDGSLVAVAATDGTFDEAQQVSSGSTPLATLLPEQWEWAKSLLGGQVPTTETVGLDIIDQAEEEEEEEDFNTDPVQDEDEGDEEHPFGMAEEPAPAPDPVVESASLVDPEDEGAVDYSAMDDEGDWDEGEEEGFEPTGDYDDFGSEDDESGAFDGLGEEEGEQGLFDDSEYVEANAGREVSLSEVRSSVVRRLSPEDLELEVSLEEFDAAFSTQAPAVAIEIGDADAWLADQVADYVRQANAQIAKTHADNVAMLRRDYVALMAQHSEKVQRDLSTDRPGAQYSELMKAARADFNADLAAGTEETATARNEITRRFEAEAEEAAKAAAESARARFHTQNRPLRERLLAEAGTAVEVRSEERFAHNRHVLLQMRRKDAALAMELGATRAMQLLAERQDVQHEQEMQLLREWNERIVAFIDENRKHDVARTEALAESFARDGRVEEITATFAAEREALAAAHRQQIADIEAEMVSNRERAMVELKEARMAADADLRVEREKAESSNQTVLTLQEQMREMEDSVRAKYEDRISTLTADRDSYNAELERANQIQSRSNKVLLVLVIVMAIAALAVGFIWGSAVSDNAAGTILLTPAVEGLPLPPA